MPPKPSFPTEGAMRALLDEKHPDTAICLLLGGRFSDFDPLMMDAGCQGKVPGLMEAYAKLRDTLEAAGRWESAQEMADDWLKAHANDMLVTKIKTEADVKGKATDPAGFAGFIAQAKKLLGEQLVKNIGLCVSTTASAKRFPEETGSNFMWLDSNPYRPLPDGVTANEKNRINLTYDMRADLAALSTGVVTNNIRAVATQEYRDAVLGASPTAWTDLADQISETLRFAHTGIIPKGGNREIVVQNLLVQTLAILVALFRTGQGFTAQIRRIEMEPVSTESAAGDDEEGEYVTEGETEQQGDFTYKLTDVRMLRWIPGKNIFELQKEVDDEEANKPSLHIEMFSYYLKGSGSRGGLDTDDDDEYFAVFEDKKTNVFWLLLQILCAHPAYTGHAKEGSPKDLPVYDKVCRPQAVSVTSSDLHCDGLILRPLAPGENALSLSSLRKEALGHAVAKQLSKGAEFTRISEKHVSERRRSPVAFMIKHIRLMSYAEGLVQCEQMLALHRANPGLRLGGYIARVGDQGFSCKNRELAQRIQDTKKNQAALDLYKAEHPGHEIFI